MIKRISKKMEKSFENDGLAIIFNPVRSVILVSDYQGDNLYASYYCDLEGNCGYSSGILDRNESIMIHTHKDLYTLKDIILAKLNKA